MQNTLDNLLTTPLHAIHTSPEDYVGVIAWLASTGLASHAKAHLDELPADHPHWDALIGEFGESGLIGLGVDI